MGMSRSTRMMMATHTRALMEGWRRLLWPMSVLLLALGLSGCDVNRIPTLDEQTKAAWAQVENQYQRRADLIPNLVATVKGYASHERETLQAVTEARAKVGSMRLDAAALSDPARMKAFEQAQGQLSGALQRLMLVAEKYPDLKANQNFLSLQAQLEGTENRISVARRDYIAAVQAFNTEIRTFPGLIWHKVLYSELPPKENYEATKPGAEQAPEVNF